MKNAISLDQKATSIPLPFVKTRIKEVALSTYRNYNNNVPQHLSKEEFLALQNLRKNKNIVIQKSDKGNSAVMLIKQII